MLGIRGLLEAGGTGNAAPQHIIGILNVEYGIPNRRSKAVTLVPPQRSKVDIRCSLKGIRYSHETPGGIVFVCGREPRPSTCGRYKNIIRRITHVPGFIGQTKSRFRNRLC